MRSLIAAEGPSVDGAGFRNLPAGPESKYAPIFARAVAPHSVRYHVLDFLAAGAVFASGFVLAAPSVHAAGEDPAMNDVEFLRPGETLVFKLGWGIFSSAGETVIETGEIETDDGPRIRVFVHTESKGIVDSIYPLSNDTVTLIDPATGRTLEITVDGKEGKKVTRAVTVFDYEAGKVIHTDENRPNRNGTIDIPEGLIYDLMVTIMRVRESEMKSGEKRHVQCIVEDDVYDLELVALREDRIKTGAGKFDCVVVEPKQLGELKGFFKKGGTMKYWISRGESQQIVRMDFKAKFGTFSATLQSIKKAPPSDSSDEKPKNDKKPADENPAP